MNDKLNLMKTVLVFKTSISKKKEINAIQPFLNRLMDQNGHWNFDLEDCDNILRVETQQLEAISITSILNQQGFICEEL